MSSGQKAKCRWCSSSRRKKNMVEEKGGFTCSKCKTAYVRPGPVVYAEPEEPFTIDNSDEDELEEEDPCEDCLGLDCENCPDAEEEGEDDDLDLDDDLGLDDEEDS